MPSLTPHHPVPYVKITHPEWCKNAAIYQINTRQFTPEGTFRAAEKHLPRIKELGADIVYLLPIHEIGMVNRKGRLGSPFAVKDYYSVNREFGSFDDLKHFVIAAHELGMYVILDWVANHTAFDCNLVAEHPEWYARNWKGDFQSTPWRNWSDVIDLDFRQPALRHYMAEVMKYWVREAEVDGYRCDAAGFVPIDFWNSVRKELEAIKPVFLLAEWESRDLHAEAFDISYAWSWFDALQEIIAKQIPLHKLERYYACVEKEYPPDCLRMLFVTNHDKNSWEGTEFELFGNGVKLAIVLSVVSDGMPLIYNGQEAGNTKRLAFFERDPIAWKHHEHGDLYKQLFTLKKLNTALWNGAWGAPMIQTPNSAADHVLSFVRQNDRDKIFAVFNLSAKPLAIEFHERLHHGTYREYFRQEDVEFPSAEPLSLEPFGYRVFVQQ